MTCACCVAAATKPQEVGPGAPRELTPKPTAQAVTVPADTAVAPWCRRRLTPQPIKVRADVEMTCFSYDGVEKIKDAMRAAQACSTDACPVMMKLVAAPRYVLTTQTLDKAQVGCCGGPVWVVLVRVLRRSLWGPQLAASAPPC